MIAPLEKKMPSLFGKDSKKKELIQGLAAEFKEMERVYQLSPGDFPDVSRYQLLLGDHDFSAFPKLSKTLMSKLDEALSIDIPKLMHQISPPKSVVEVSSNPFESTPHPSDWAILAEDKVAFDAVFDGLNPTNNKLTGAQAKQPLLDTGVPSNLLQKVWALSNVDKDGSLDRDEFALALWLCQAIKQGKNLPPQLPQNLIPPSKRGFV